jgi:hypothetical protein
MAVKVYTPGQFYAAGGVVEEMFYEEVCRSEEEICRSTLETPKQYFRKRIGFVSSFEQVIKNLNSEAWRELHYMRARVRGVDYTLVYDPEDNYYPYLFVETKFYLKQRAKIQEPDQK